MKEKITVKELFENKLNPNDIDVITIHDELCVCQCDNVESLEAWYDKPVVDYDIEFDGDNNTVYLDITV